jgi:acetyl-CoA carboxylase biotin carboxyl carrier protein
VTLTAKDVAEITRLLEESSFDELYLELDGVKLSLKRNGAAGARVGAAGSGMPAAPGASMPTGASSAVRSASVAPNPAPPDASGSPSSQADPNIHGVSSPLLGTYYRAPKPGAPPYVEVGSMVEEDTIVGIIEVMKLMNTVRAGVRGRVTEILARDGILVEYGETLLRIAKSG